VLGRGGEITGAEMEVSVTQLSAEALSCRLRWDPFRRKGRCAGGGGGGGSRGPVLLAQGQGPSVPGKTAGILLHIYR